MRCCQLVAVLWCVLGAGLAAAAPATMDAPRFNPDDIKTLEYIARGYEGNGQHQQPIRVRGRIFFEQKAMDGRQVGAGDLISARWVNFEFMQKGTKKLSQNRFATDGAQMGTDQKNAEITWDRTLLALSSVFICAPSVARESFEIVSKRRYVQDMLHEVGKKQFFALDNDRQIMIYADNVFRMIPLAEEESEWSDAMDEQAAFIFLSTAKGAENVARGLRTLVRQVTKEDYLGQFDGRLSVQLNDEGVFTIHVTTRRTDTTYKIDSRKGFNLVELTDESSGKVLRRTRLKNEYKRDSEGKWVLSAGEFNHSNSASGVRQTKKLEVSEILVGGFECPDSLFEKQSLNMPADITVEDHHFTPPLIIRRGQGQPTRDNLDKLLEAPIKSMDMAEVGASGDVKVKPHEAYVQHQGAAGAAPAAAVAAARPGGWSAWYYAGVAGMVLVAAGLVVCWRRRAVR